MLKSIQLGLRPCQLASRSRPERTATKPRVRRRHRQAAAGRRADGGGPGRRVGGAGGANPDGHAAARARAAPHAPPPVRPPASNTRARESASLSACVARLRQTRRSLAACRTSTETAVQALSAPAWTCMMWWCPQVRRAGALRKVESVHARRGRHAGVDAGACCCAGHGRRDKCGSVCPSICLPTSAWAAQQLGVHRARPAATWCSVGVSTGCAQRKLCRVAAAWRVPCVHALALLGVDARSRSQEPLHTFNHIKYPIIHPLCAAGRQEFVAGLDGLPEEAKAALAALTPATYVGNAAAQARAVHGHL